MLLATKDVAERLGVTPHTIEKWRSQGGGPKFVKVGRAVRYKPASLQEFIDAREVENTSQMRSA